MAEETIVEETDTVEEMMEEEVVETQDFSSLSKSELLKEVETLSKENEVLKGRIQRMRSNGRPRGMS